MMLHPAALQARATVNRSAWCRRLLITAQAEKPGWPTLRARR
jgi:hypothetical protein